MTPPPKLSISATFSEMRNQAVENREVLVRVTLLFAVLTSVAVLLEVGGPFGLAVSLGLSILLGAAYRGMISALVCLPGPFVSGAELWARIRPLLARLIWVSLLLALGIVLGIIALVVPALILLTIWSVVVPALVAEDLPVFRSFGRSAELVKGNGWRVFAVVMLLGVIAGILLLLLLAITSPLGTGILGAVVLQFLLACLIFPISAIGPAALYNQLIPSPEDPQATLPETEPLP